MPGWLYKQLEQGPKIRTRKIKLRSGKTITEEIVDGETNGVLPILKRLINSDPYINRAWLCHPTVKQIGKEKNEGGFCGFRNIQMQASYLQGSKAPGNEHFPGRTPGILKLQEHIEDAWDAGIHWYSREQIGKLRGTRKWIGTLEVRWQSPYILHFSADTIRRHTQYIRASASPAKSISSGISQVNWPTTNS
jgi:hypothetical protein